MIRHGGQLDELARLGGCRPEEMLDFSVNLHPDGMSEGLFPVLFRALEEVGPYPEAHAERLSALAGERWGIAATRILFGNGSSELLELFVRCCGCRRALLAAPCYLEYAACCRQNGLAVRTRRLREAEGFRMDLARLTRGAQAGDLVILGNPNNPTGGAVSAAELRACIVAHPKVQFLVDEAFADFSGETLLSHPLPTNAAVLRSMTKIHAIAGLRLGYIVASPAVVRRMRERQVPWSVGTVAARAAEWLLRQPPRETAAVAELREELRRGLERLPLVVYPSAANYLLVKPPREIVADLARRRIAVRDCADYPGLGRPFVRIAVRRREENARLLEALREILAPEQPETPEQPESPESPESPETPEQPETPESPESPRISHSPLRARRTPALMVQGTCSNAGKSVLCAAFCRILLQDGYSVAPFKAQNMALNSAVTPDGGEIGRAQAVQAAACRLDADVRMNPVLLKPNSDLGSQVIVLGRPIGNYRVRDYFARKRELWAQVAAAYDSLSAEHDCVVLEGAGSPGEVNLKASDIVNMRMARHAEAAVLLAGDIDRGGVYASFIGTYATFEPWERELLYGFLVNKFRGDASLLADAHEYVVRMTGKPVVGVIDWQPDLGLPEEDSVGFASGFAGEAAKTGPCLDVAVVVLGHIANFTDFAPLAAEPDVRLRAVRGAAELGEPDAILLPGSKNTAADWRALKEGGLAEAIHASRAYRIGICGGLQLLGRRVADPLGIESPPGTVTECLGELPMETVMRPRKTVRRTAAGGFFGYEIHHGESRLLEEVPGIAVHRSADGREIGYERDGLFATYLHGVFDDDRFRRLFLNRLRARRGWTPIEPGTRYGFEAALDRLADHVRSRVDLKALYRRMGL